MKNTTKKTITTPTADPIRTITQAQREALGKVMTLQEAFDLGWSSIALRMSGNHYMSKHNPSEAKEKTFTIRKKKGAGFDLGGFEYYAQEPCPLENTYIRIDRTASAKSATAYIVGYFSHFNDGGIDVRFITEFQQVNFTNDQCEVKSLPYCSWYTEKDFVEVFKKLWRQPWYDGTTQLEEAVQEFKEWLIAMGTDPKEFE